MYLSFDACNASANAVVDLVDRAGGPGSIRILDAGGLVLTSIALARPAFDTAVDGLANAAGLPLSGVGSAEAATGAAPAKFVVTDAVGVVIWGGTVPEDMTLDRATIGANQPVAITSWSYVQPAG